MILFSRAAFLRSISGCEHGICGCSFVVYRSFGLDYKAFLNVFAEKETYVLQAGSMVCNYEMPNWDYGLIETDELQGKSKSPFIASFKTFYRGSGCLASERLCTLRRVLPTVRSKKSSLYPSYQSSGTYDIKAQQLSILIFSNNLL